MRRRRRQRGRRALPTSTQARQHIAPRPRGTQSASHRGRCRGRASRRWRQCWSKNDGEEAHHHESKSNQHGGKSGKRAKDDRSDGKLAQRRQVEPLAEKIGDRVAAELAKIGRQQQGDARSPPQPRRRGREAIRAIQGSRLPQARDRRARQRNMRRSPYRYKERERRAPPRRNRRWAARERRLLPRRRSATPPGP